MSGDIVKGQYGGAAFDLDRATGVLSWDGTGVILMRVDLINRLFASVLEVPLFSTLLRRAGMAAGEEYAVTTLLGAAPAPPQSAQAPQAPAPLPAPVGAAAAAHMSARRAAALEPQSDARAQEVERRWGELRSALAGWQASLPEGRRRAQWQQMHELDVYGGWGRAEVVDLRLAPAAARIRVVESFIARTPSAWERAEEHGHPVCSFLEGYFLGEARVILARGDLVCVEQVCRAQGGPACEFSIERDTSLNG